MPKVYNKENLDKTSIGGLIDVISDVAVGTEAAKSKDILGRVYEYFLGQFANAEDKKGGQFYTPRSIVKLMVEMLRPFNVRVYDPACGSGWMFIMSEKFVLEHSGRIGDLAIYGQESNHTTWKLAKMNLAIRGIDSSLIKQTRTLVALDPEGEEVKLNYGHPELDSGSPRKSLKTRSPIYIFGTERAGISDDLLNLSDMKIRIPMRPGVSSLNLATSVAIVVYNVIYH